MGIWGETFRPFHSHRRGLACDGINNISRDRFAKEPCTHGSNRDAYTSTHAGPYVLRIALFEDRTEAIFLSPKTVCVTR